ncbi:TIGR01457 family HAD-type hydrolase [soil metagenome]
MPIDLSRFAAVLLDLDGTVYHDEFALPGAIALIQRFQQEGRRFACLSNSTTSPLRITERLARMGVEVDPSHIYTAAAATADYVLQTFGKTRKPRVFNLATEGIQEMLDGSVEWVATAGEPCDAVIVGAPVNVYATEERNRLALQLLRKNAALVGICADRVYPSPRGIEFGSGAFCAMLAFAAKVTPIFCGKPNAIFFQELCHRLSVEPQQCLLIGDNIEADVIGGKAVGMQTALVLTGVTRRRDLLMIAKEQQPDFVIEELTEL